MRNECEILFIIKKRVASPASRSNQAEQKTNFARDKTRNLVQYKHSLYDLHSMLIFVIIRR